MIGRETFCGPVEPLRKFEPQGRGPDRGRPARAVRLHHEAEGRLSATLETAAHFAAESSTGTNVEVSTTDDFTKRRRCAGL
ncbi:MAG: hypothetical protein MZV49_18120 [Rhodopseudomonas palustris]|nr:hypothetical protein [Rhodopseudomonas palustris]